MSKTAAYVTLALIAVVWVFCFITIGFNVFGVFFGIFGTFMVGAGFNGWVKSKGEMYLANKYDESKKHN